MADAPLTDAAAPAAWIAERTSPAPEPFGFTGSGSEYFRIWIVNLALTYLTLGIYSPWAKVRRMQYLYRNTQLAGSGFDYHGRPIAILKGRAITVGLILLYQGISVVNPVAALVVGVLMALVLPWLLLRSLAFRLANTSWRGLRFHFEGSAGSAYRVFLLWPILAIVSLGLLAPAAHHALKTWQHQQSAFGRSRFGFDATVGAFYRVWLMTAALVVILPVMVAVFVGVLASQGFESRDIIPGVADGGVILLVVLAVIAFYAGLLSVMPYFITHVQNLIWNRTTLGTHRFESRLRFGRTLGITVSNMILTVLTLGLFRPFAVIRMARYRVEAMTLVPGESLDHFVGQQAREVEAFGEEVSEFFDIDIAL
jgi:uncharacterized membrane protein YjgN (DUF898 family)